MPSEDSSTECPGVRDGVHCFKHRNTCCYCAQEPPASKLRCKGCGHTEGEGCGCPAHAYVGREHCWRCEGRAALRAMHDKLAHHDACEDCDVLNPCPCCGLRDAAREEPPQGAEEPWPCGDCGATVPAGQGWCTQPDCQEKAKAALAADAPPQPERRPPYAVAYSVGGHLYELALPGDAAVQTVDGALIITHALGPVNGVVQVQPIAGKEA